MKKILLIGIVLLLSACSSTVQLNDAERDHHDQKQAKDDIHLCCNVPNIDPLDEPDSILSKRSIYFDFDHYQVSEEYAGLTEAHARYLLSNKHRKVMLEGNTDGRGSREYNLALGQKRAQEVLRRMQMYGISADNIEVVSYGSERPKAEGSDEAAWAQNRRVDIVYLKE